MPAYSFQIQFVEPVETGAKTHTIRGKRKHRPKPGQPFYGFYGMRTKQCRLLVKSVITKVQDIEIKRVRLPGRKAKALTVFLDGEELYPSEIESLAKRDGFTSFLHMAQFWKGRIPFKGDLIHWKPVQK